MVGLLVGKATPACAGGKVCQGLAGPFTVSLIAAD